MSWSGTVANLNALIAKGPPTPQAFQKFVFGYFKKNGRDFPWRETKDPYKILVSEVMLQQTQTERVVVKYGEFLKAFPTWKAPQYRDTRGGCEGMDGARVPPQTAEGLKNLPGVGPYTAAAVAAFAFDEPAPMIETNIRSVYLYTFYPQVLAVSDKEVLQKVEETLYKKDPRSWFYALMDLGAELKKQTKGINHRSKHHVKQSKFHGSLP